MFTSGNRALSDSLLSAMTCGPANNTGLLSVVFRRVLSNYRVIIARLSTVSPYMFANLCSVVLSSSREAAPDLKYDTFLPLSLPASDDTRM